MNVPTKVFFWLFSILIQSGAAKHPIKLPIVIEALKLAAVILSNPLVPKAIGIDELNTTLAAIIKNIAKDTNHTLGQRITTFSKSAVDRLFSSFEPSDKVDCFGFFINIIQITTEIVERIAATVNAELILENRALVNIDTVIPNVDAATRIPILAGTCSAPKKLPKILPLPALIKQAAKPVKAVETISGVKLPEKTRPKHPIVDRINPTPITPLDPNLSINIPAIKLKKIAGIIGAENSDEICPMPISYSFIITEPSGDTWY